MGLTLVGLTTEQRGNELAETGINLDSFSCRYFPQFKDKLSNFQGQTKGFAVTDKYSRVVTITGESSGSTGIMASTMNTAITFNNDVGTFVGVAAGTNAGGFYLDEITESQSRDGWRSISGTWSSDPLVT
jgi:hypothetical protein